MRVVQDDLWLCVDCLMCAVNGDTSGIDDEKREERVVDGVAALGPHLVPDFDSETEEGIRDFSTCGCDACGSPLAGTMHRFAILGEGEDTPEEPEEFERVTYSFGRTPEDLIKMRANEQCPDGYPMTIRSETEWAVIAARVNAGIDSHLEAVTERSSFDASTGECLVHPDELHVLLRRLGEQDFSENGDDGPSLRSCILETLGIEEI